jgi:RHS repeat-associated protein
VTDTYDYDAWGNTVIATGTTPNVCLYRGEQYDPELSLYYLRARYLNPLTGRFLSLDRAKGLPFHPRTLHKYLYAGGDPVNITDPTGNGFFAKLWRAVVVTALLAIGEGGPPALQSGHLEIEEVWEEAIAVAEKAAGWTPNPKP